MTWSSGHFRVTESKKSQGRSLKWTSPVLHRGENSGTVSAGTSAGHRGYGESPQRGYRRPGRAEQCEHSADAEPGDGDVLARDPSVTDRGFEARRRNTAGTHKTTIYGRYAAGWTSLSAAASSVVLRAGGRVPSAPRLAVSGVTAVPLLGAQTLLPSRAAGMRELGGRLQRQGPPCHHNMGEHSALASTERPPVEIKQNWQPASVFWRHWHLSSTEKYLPRPGILHP